MTDKRKPHQPLSDHELEQFLRETFPRLDPTLRGRNLSELQASYRLGMREEYWRLRRRVIAVALAVVLLVGLGFIPFPLGGVKGAWAQALAAAREIAALHVQVVDQNSQVELDQWVGEDGFSRKSTYRDGRLTRLILRDATSIDYNVDTKSAEEYSIAPGSLETKDVDTFTNRKLKSVAAIVAASPQIKLSESRVGSLWSGIYNVIKIEGITNTKVTLNNIDYSIGDEIGIIIKTDPTSARILEMEQYKLDITRAVQDAKFVTIEWDVEAPPELRSFAYPPGTKVERHTLWQKRPQQTIATADLQHWGSPFMPSMSTAPETSISLFLVQSCPAQCCWTSRSILTLPLAPKTAMAAAI